MYRTPPAGPIVANGSTKTNKTIITKQVSETTTVTTRNNTVKGTYTITDGFEAVKCASEGETCSCLGQVHFGVKSDSFLDMHAKNVSIFDTRGSGKGYLACDGKSFN